MNLKIQYSVKWFWLGCHLYGFGVYQDLRVDLVAVSGLSLRRQKLAVL